MNDKDLIKTWYENNLSRACSIRVTNTCNQKCRHCMFRSGPSLTKQMSTTTCKEINSWIPDAVLLNIMGGEFTILPDYPEILIALSKDRGQIRLVTNGFWSSNPDKFFDCIQEIKEASCNEIQVAISSDMFHKERGHAAIQLLEDNNPEILLQTKNNFKYSDIVPVGRAWDNHLGDLGYTTRQCESMCSMIITEDGMIHKCPFGYFPWRHFTETTWYEAQEYVYNWRFEKLHEGMNCRLCMETVEVGRCRSADVKVSFEGERVYV